MWCYQMPDFEAQLITELQRQQQQRQFCDTLLKTKDVSVPAHSCVLSAISPQISSALSSLPAPPAGRGHLLEFRALGGCTLLRLARLFYSGEMVGEGESERQEAISAAAELGIHGLVEVPRTQVDSRQPGRRVEVGVQTEPLEEEMEGGDGCTVLSRDTATGSEGCTWAQAEGPQATVASPPQLSAALETIDMTAIQTVDSSLLQEQIPYIPLSLLYAPEELQTYQLSSAPAHFLQESTACGHRPASIPTLPLHPPVSPPPGRAARQDLSPPPGRAARRDISPVERWDNSNLEEFQGNIPGFIDHFLNPPPQERPRRGRPRGRRRAAAAGGARSAGASGSGTSNRRGGRRGRGRLTQTVDVQDVGASKVQKLFLQRCSTRLSRAGQGGGAVGRTLCLKSREVLKSAGRGQSRGAQFKMWTFCPRRDGPPYKEEASGGGSSSRKRTRKPTNQDELSFIRPHETQPRSAALLPFFTPPAHSRNVLPTSSSSSSLLLSPVLASSASSALSGTPAPTAAPPPPPGEERHIDQLLDEVMMGLNIMPTNNTSAQTLAANALRGGGAASSETPVVQQQQQGEGELNDILDHFLLSFERHINSTAAREEVSAQSPADVAERATQTQQQQDVAEPRENDLKQRKTQHATRKRTRTLCSSSLKRDGPNVGNLPLPPSVKATRVSPDLQDKQLQQIAVVKLERRRLLQNPSSLSAKIPAVSQITSSTVKLNMNGSCKKKNTQLPTKSYPIRSKIRGGHLDPEFYLEQPLQLHNTCTHRRSRLRQPSRSSENKSGSREEQHEKTETQRDTGSKRAAEEAEPPEEAPAVKRVRAAGEQQTGSPVALTAPPDDEIIDVETVSVGAEDGVAGQVVSGFGADEVISVGAGDCGQTGGDQDSTTGSPEDEEIDVIGGSSPGPTPVTLTWTEPSEEEEDDALIIEEERQSTVG